MGPAALVMAWLSSLSALVLEQSGALDLRAAASDATPRVGLCALAWIAIAGMPRATLAKDDFRAWWGSLMVCLPAFAAALALDQVGGAAPSSAWTAALLAISMVALSALAADLARRDLRSQRIHAAVWLAIVLGFPMLRAALEWGARRAESVSPPWISAAASFSPLEWARSSVEAGSGPFPAVIGTIAMCAIVALSRRGAQP